MWSSLRHCSDYTIFLQLGCDCYTDLARIVRVWLRIQHTSCTLPYPATGEQEIVVIQPRWSPPGTQGNTPPLLSVSLPPEPGLSGASTRMPPVVHSCVSGKGPFKEAEATDQTFSSESCERIREEEYVPWGHWRTRLVTESTFGGTATPRGRADSPPTHST